MTLLQKLQDKLGDCNLERIFEELAKGKGWYGFDYLLTEKSFCFVLNVSGDEIEWKLNKLLSQQSKETWDSLGSIFLASKFKIK